MFQTWIFRIYIDLRQMRVGRDMTRLIG